MTSYQKIICECSLDLFRYYSNSKKFQKIFIKEKNDLVKQLDTNKKIIEERVLLLGKIIMK